LQHIGRVITGALAFLPNWVVALALFFLVGGLSWRALKQVGRTPASETEAPGEDELLTGEAGQNEHIKEKIGEHETV